MIIFPQLYEYGCDRHLHFVDLLLGFVFLRLVLRDKAVVLLVFSVCDVSANFWDISGLHIPACSLYLGVGRCWEYRGAVDCPLDRSICHVHV